MVTIALTAASDPARANGDSDALKSAFRQSCVKCHGHEGRVEGQVNLLELSGAEDLTTRPELVRRLIDVLDAGIMPPEDEPPIALQYRESLVRQLKDVLRIAMRAEAPVPRVSLRRMNRFQYNNAVQDLFDLDVVVFPLPERMLREHGNYFQPRTGRMPGRLKAGSRPLGKSQLIESRLAGVTPFPQDLRAEHGFDNRGDHLTLSPLLLESFLRLGRSIVDSPDFNEQTCGIWEAFFAAPTAGHEIATTEPASRDAASITGSIVRERLRIFLGRAFRRPVEPDVLNRYARHVLSRIEHGEPFTGSMKSAAAAAIASPRFFYLYNQPTSAETIDGSEHRGAFDLASRLSFFLWGSIPDQRLLDLAAADKLREPQVLAQEVQRMLHDRRLKRFCDSFPAQWLQLERIISSAPDTERFPQFYFAQGQYRASMHMMLEPLLLFETVLIEDHSILKFIDSDFAYRSDLLKAWYRDGSQGRVGSPAAIEFERVPVTDRRQGGMLTNAAVLTMTSSALRTKPITRGAWVATVILNDPPQPPPGNVPPLADQPGEAEALLTLRERLVAHRKRADCAGCHRRIDPLGFALENYDAMGVWRDVYDNGRAVDASGTLFARHEFNDIVEFKNALLKEKDRFTRAFASHVLAFALGRGVEVADSLALDRIVQATADADYRFQALITQVILSEPFSEIPLAEEDSPTRSAPENTRESP